MNKQDKKDLYNLKRLIYMWRRYAGIRDATHEKIWLPSDLTELEQRIKEYFENKKKFNWNQGQVIFKDED